MRRSLLSFPALLLILAVVAPHTARAQVDAAELLLRLDRLEGENRRINGQLEQTQNQVRRLEEQLRRFQSDVDFRFKEGGGKGMPAQPAQPAQAPQRRSDAFDPAANPNAAGAPRSINEALAQPRPNLPQGGLEQGQISLDPLAQPRGGQAPVANAAPGTAKGDFDFAKSFLDRGDNELAEGSFREFLRAHPRDRLTPDAVFYLGETFYRRNRFREAAERYLSVTTDHSKSGRAAEAMLKLGMSLRGMGAKEEACGTYSEVTRKYPNASASIKQAIERERKRAQCAA